MLGKAGAAEDFLEKGGHGVGFFFGEKFGKYFIDHWLVLIPCGGE